MASNADLFEADPDWSAYATKHGHLKESSPDQIPSADWDIGASRAQQAISEGEWAKNHPLSLVGYKSATSMIKVRDGAAVSVKTSFPARLSSDAKSSTTTKEKVAVLFVTHGGGWVQGTHITEKAWLLWPLYEKFDLCIISVEYRLAPEHEFPTWMNDCWDVLEQVAFAPGEFLGKFDFGNSGSTAPFDLDGQKIMLAGSSAGAGCAAYLSQTCRDKVIPIYGVLLNVPVLCDYRHQPTELIHAQSSYSQCTDTFLSSSQMKAVWDLVIPSTSAGSDPTASPLLGNVGKLPRHAVFVAGQDPLRDEGIAYARKLEKEGVDVKLNTYKGVPHTFAEFWELKATQKFWADIRGVFDEWLA